MRETKGEIEMTVNVFREILRKKRLPSQRRIQEGGWLEQQ
jgi:hypothetical protein